MRELLIALQLLVVTSKVKTPIENEESSVFYVLKSVVTISLLASAAQANDSPRGEPARDTVAVIELNHVHDGCGKRVFEQWIWWRGLANDGDVTAWRMAQPQQRVERDFERGGYLLRFWDGEIFREVQAASYSVIWSQFDREVRDRDYLPKEKRRGLSHEKTNDPHH